MELRLFGAYLHGPIVNASNGPKEVPVMSPKELMEYRSHGEGSRLLDVVRKVEDAPLDTWRDSQNQDQGEQVCRVQR